MRDKQGNTLMVNRKAIAIYGAVLVAVAIAIGIAYGMGAIGGKDLPAPAPGIHRMPITYDTTGAPEAEAPDVTFTRRDGTTVTIFLDLHSHPDYGQFSFGAWVGTPDNQRKGSTTITVGQSAVLDGVRITVVANWTGSKYRSDAVDLRLADAGS